MIPSDLQARLGTDLGGVFYLHGEDEYQKEQAARALTEAHLDAGTADFNYDLLRGSEVNVETLLSTAGTPPMMGEWRVVLLKETQALASSAKTRNALLDVVRKPPPGLALILLCTVPERSGARFYKDLEKVARSAEFAVPSLEDLPGWLMKTSEERFGKSMEVAAATAVAQAIGPNSGALLLELEKFAALAHDAATISLEIVSEAGTHIARQNRWEWLDLVGHRRIGEAVYGLDPLLASGENGVGLVIALASQLLRIGVAAAGGERALGEILPANQRWLARRYVAQARRWSPEDVTAALEGLLRVDRLLKSSPQSDQHFLESWLLGLEASGRAAA